MNSHKKENTISHEVEFEEAGIPTITENTELSIPINTM
jgi:hypothetical protein